MTICFNKTTSISYVTINVIFNISRLNGWVYKCTNVWMRRVYNVQVCGRRKISWFSYEMSACSCSKIIHLRLLLGKCPSILTFLWQSDDISNVVTLQIDIAGAYTHHNNHIFLFWWLVTKLDLRAKQSLLLLEVVIIIITIIFSFDLYPLSSFL